MNYLEMIFEGQKHLMHKYHSIEWANGSVVIDKDQRGNLNSRRVQLRLNELFAYTVRELGEAMAELKNKPWKNTTVETDKQAFIDEIGDVFHFFVEMCITAGMSAEDLHRAYFRMHAKNTQRQDSDY